MSPLQLSRLARYHKLCGRLKDNHNPACPALFCRQWRCLGRYERQLRLAGLGGLLGLSMALKPPALSAQCLTQDMEFLVNTYTTSTQSSPDIAMDADGDFVIAWYSYGQDGPSEGIYAQRYNAAGMPQGSEFKVNTYTITSQRDPTIAMDADGDFVIAWQSYDQDASFNYGIYAQRYNATGMPQGSEFPVNTYTTSSQTSPAIAMDADGNFVIAWNSDLQDGSYYGIYAQRYNAAGMPQGSEFPVNTYTTSQQRFSAIAMHADGDFVIVWQSYDQDALYGIYAKRYNAAGMPLDSEFPVNTYTTSDQEFPTIAMDADGNFVIAWQSSGQDGSFHGIYAQRYNAAGMPQGSEFKVNTYTTSNQEFPTIAMNANGDFAIAWESTGQDGSIRGIYAQRYNAAGIPQGSEFPVNTYTTNDQKLSAIAMDANGNFVIAWASDLQDGSDDGIYAQHYQCCTVVDWYADMDEDGYGDPTMSMGSCTQPEGYVDNTLDDCPATFGLMGDPCDDGNPNSLGDRIDENCECKPLNYIPTLSQWGLIILGLLLSIFGTSSLNQKSKKQRTVVKN